MPVTLDCNFIVDSTNGNGLGIRSLKGVGIANVFMHTSATPGIGNQNQTNPNPPSGYIVVQLADNYNRYLAGTSGFISPLSGSNLTSVTANSVYVITSVGTGTQAQWQAIGLPLGVIPAVGAAFIASSSTSVPGSGTVQIPAAAGSTVDHIEVIGDFNQTLAPLPNPIQPGVGGQAILVCLAATNSSTTTLVATAPANNTVIGLTFYLNNSSALAGAAGT